MDNTIYYEAENLVYEGKTPKGLRRMATNLEKRGDCDKSKVDIFRAFADAMDNAPKHSGKPCLTFVVYGVCPAWSHG